VREPVNKPTLQSDPMTIIDRLLVCLLQETMGVILALTQLLNLNSDSLNGHLQEKFYAVGFEHQKFQHKDPPRDDT
jgi:hypothetical protein